MMLVLLLILVGLVLVFFEVLLPGGILGVLAFVCYVVAAIWVSSETGSALYGVLAFLGIGVLTLLMIIIQLRVMNRGPWRKSFYLETAITGTSQKDVAGAEVVGKTGRVVFPLTPTGVIEVEGQRLEAAAQNEFLEKGTQVVVERVENFRVVVRRAEK